MPWEQAGRGCLVEERKKKVGKGCRGTVLAANRALLVGSVLLHHALLIQNSCRKLFLRIGFSEAFSVCITVCFCWKE